MALAAPTLIVVGHGPAGRGMVDEIVRHGRSQRILVLDDRAGDGSAMPPPWAAAGVEVHHGVRVTGLDPVARRLIAGGVAISFHAVVIADRAELAPALGLELRGGTIATDDAGRTTGRGVFAIAGAADPVPVAEAVARHLGVPLAAGSSPAIAIPPHDPDRLAAGSDSDDATSTAIAIGGGGGGEPPLYGATSPPDLSSLLVVAAASTSSWSATCRPASRSRARR